MNDKNLKKLINKISLSLDTSIYNQKELNEILKMIYYYFFVIKKEKLDSNDFIDFFFYQKNDLKRIITFNDFLEYITTSIFHNGKNIKV